MKKVLSIAMAVLALVLMAAAPALAGQSTLAWTAPTESTDGKPLLDLAGFKVYYGTESGNYTEQVDVGNVTTFTVMGLPEGVNHFFAVTAYDLAGNESGYSNEASCVTPDSAPPNPGGLSVTCGQ